MLSKIINQIATTFAVLCIIFFCTSGMTGCNNNNPPILIMTPPEHSESITPEETATVPSAPQQETNAPTDPTHETEVPTAPTEAPPIQLTTAPEGYFDDALFIGDSRTVGLYEYGRIPGAAYFATTGMSVYSIFYDEVGNTSFQDLMESRTFGKIYVMLGINELGYDFECTVTEYEELIEWIRQRQPDAIIYIEANLHVSADRSNSDRIYNNANLNAFNEKIAELADGVQIFYLDVNPLFDDDNGNLADEFTVDDTHVLGKYYRTWSDWIMENAAVIPT